MKNAGKVHDKQEKQPNHSIIKNKKKRFLDKVDAENVINWSVVGQLN